MTALQNRLVLYPETAWDSTAFMGLFPESPCLSEAEKPFQEKLRLMIK